MHRNDKYIIKTVSCQQKDISYIIIYFYFDMHTFMSQQNGGRNKGTGKKDEMRGDGEDGG